MEIGAWTADGEWSATPDMNRAYREIRLLGLETNLAELEAFGFTVIDDALPASLTQRLRDAVLRSANRKAGRQLDLETEAALQEDQLTPFLLYTDPVFEEALLNPRPLALITYLVGYSCWLSSMTSHVKGPGKVGLALHSDTVNGVPAPFAPYAQVANCNYALTDYTEEAGALAMVPGSHRLARQPTALENKVAGNQRNPDVIPVEVPAGAAIIWHGNQWHGSFPRKIPGLRINLAMYFCRQYLAPQEDYAGVVPAELLERHGRDSRMAQLLGLNRFNGWRSEGPPMELIGKLPAGRNWQA
jgi:hypothetical protein